MKKLYNVGIYTRLSVDDASNSQKKDYIPADGSVSIENQKLLLSKFTMLNGWIETKVYTDDGYSGGNFNRPAFKQMMEDVKSGLINLVLVKDLSRLGRDYIEVGRYTDIIFPSMGCRFVSILDEIDTAKDDNDMMHFRSLMNDYHLKDLSNKIKTVFHSKAVKGSFMTGRPPFGYIRSEENKHQLIIEPQAAHIIRRIFALRIDGAGYGKIAGALNDDSIPSPNDYWRVRSGKEVGEPTLWKYATIRDILRQEAYIGNVLSKTEGTMSYKSKKIIKKPESEWIRHENVHEPIIDKTTWEQVREIGVVAKENGKNRRDPQPSLFVKKLICMGCGTPLVSHQMSRVFKDGIRHRTGTQYSCGRHNASGYKACSPHTISENPLKAIILNEMQIFSQAVSLDEAALLDKLRRAMAIDDTERQDLLRQDVKRLERLLSELANIAADLYEDKVTSKISEITFATLMGKNEDERQKRQAQFEETNNRLIAINNKILCVSKWAEVVRKYVDLNDLCRADIEELIDHIEIGESDYSSGGRQQEIKIYWQFIGYVGA